MVKVGEKKEPLNVVRKRNKTAEPEPETGFFFYQHRRLMNKKALNLTHIHCIIASDAGEILIVAIFYPQSCCRRLTSAGLGFRLHDHALDDVPIIFAKGFGKAFVDVRLRILKIH